MHSIFLIINWIMYVNSSILTDKLHVKLEQSSETTKSNEFSSLNFQPEVISESNKILVVKEHCSTLRGFSLSKNFTFDCFLKYLPIEFVLKHSSGNETLLTNELQNRQENSDVCRKVRRYDK